MTAKPKKKPNPPRVCIFCGGRPVSKEHIWSEWTYEYIPRAASNHSTATFRATNPLFGQHDTKRHNGAVNSRKIHAVCETCNNGWMSVLENAAKPHLIRLFCGKPISLSEPEQKVIATWVVMKCMVLEWYQQADQLCSTPAERLFLKENLAPPQKWKVLIATQSSAKWRVAWNRSGSMVGTAPLGEGIALPDEMAVNLQTFTLGFGRLLVNAIYNRVPNLNFHPTVSLMRFLRQIWPFSAGVDWPLSPIPDEAIEAIANGLTDWSRAMNWPGKMPLTS